VRIVLAEKGVAYETEIVDPQALPEDLMELIAFGRFSEIDARHGEVLQLRPKGKNSQVLTDAVNQHGEPIQTLPLGFYLRKSFTREILQNFLRERL